MLKQTPGHIVNSKSDCCVFVGDLFIFVCGCVSHIVDAEAASACKTSVRSVRAAVEALFHLKQRRSVLVAASAALV